ncbi:zinc-dependent alcohol dehydrogenase [Granulicella mallensis]|uniref:L-iditol 2-dehydrogenase n=1 Tax=Granulicella mallensis (strain ATCC BAA-1857 / DSM 23137 / MP5ACTX8) TaxID=682795 RepID=G8NXA1_GRAMM|nr:galactitol-1-phosphate 5-dehydrogenase [Granulicella mallensis]AEU37808.1 L-iditol 2-dehydrogenase [Granulicella mallensis MP5ACTX8]
MKALLLSEYNHLAIQDLPDPTPGPDELLIQVAACGICGSDVHGYDGSTGRRIPPIVMGHEAAGIVAAVGTEVSGFAPGDRVTFDSTVFCGVCDHCLQGQVNLCDNRQVIGVSCGEYRRAGAFAELLTVPARVAYRLPDNLSFPEAAMLEAVSVALHGVAVSELMGEEVVLVIGAGMIGLLLLQAARAAGASCVYISDVDETRLKLAEELGADETLLATGAALVEEILRRTDGRGVDMVLEAVGRDETIAAGIDCVRKGGTVTLVGNISPQITLPLQKVVSRQIRLQGSCASAGEYPQAMELIARNEIKVASLITAVAPLSDGASWFERLHAREPNLMKIVLDPRSDSSTERAR